MGYQWLRPGSTKKGKGKKGVTDGPLLLKKSTGYTGKPD
jgi:hypothetical protein